MHYTIDKCRFYGPDERYNTGAGLWVTTQKLEEADGIWDLCCREDPTKWAVTFSVNGTVTREWGVSKEVALRSMRDAYRRRCTPTDTTAARSTATLAVMRASINEKVDRILKLEAALKVITIRHRYHLEIHDPKALQQAQEALTS